MQNFEVLLPSSQSTSSRHPETDVKSPKTPSRGGEQFGDLMQRALTGAPQDSANAGDNHSLDATATKTTKSAADTKDTPHSSKAKKSHRRHPANSDAVSMPLTMPTPGAISNPQLLTINVADEGSAEKSSDPDAQSGAPAAAKSQGTELTQLMSAQMLACQTVTLQPAPTATSSARGSTAQPQGNSTASMSLPVKPDGAGTVKELAQDLESSLVAANASADSKAAAASASPAETAVAISPEAAAEMHTVMSETGKNDSDHDSGAKNADSTPPAPIEIKPSVNHPAAYSSNLHGTSAAKQDVTMKNADKIAKVAGPTEQDLPGKASIGGEELPSGQKLSVKATHTGTKAESLPDTTAAAKISTAVEPAAPTATAAAVTPVSETEGSVRVLERTHDIVALHAMRLGDTSSDSLHVVVKPGDGIQLSLELRKHQDGIEVQASLHKGDYEQLRQYWPELQQRLEARGVRVGALTTSENFTSTSQQQFQQSKQQQSSNQDPMYAGAFAEFALAGTLSEAPATRAARATAYRGWETWA